MQTTQVETVIELPSGEGKMLVEAKRPANMIERKGQMVGFFIRKRLEGDRFMIGKWEDFSPRWMVPVGEFPEGWLGKIDGREKLYGREYKPEGLPERQPQEPVRPVALSQANTPITSGSFDYSTGRVRKRK